MIGTHSLGIIASQSDGSAPSSPDMTSLTAWYRGDNVETDGSGNVRRWPDKTSNGFDLYQSISGKRPPTGTVNGHPALDFHGSDYRLDGENGKPKQADLGSLGLGTAFVVVRPEKINNNNDPNFIYNANIIFDFGNTNAGASLQSDNSSLSWCYDGSFVVAKSAANTITTNQNIGLIWTNDALNDGIQNETDHTFNKSTASGPTNESKLLYVGHIDNNSVLSFDGKIAEILFYSDNHRSNIKTRAYLNARYGLSL